MSSTVITRVELRYEQDVISARSRAHLIAEQLGFDKSDQARISTAVSEMARNMFQYAGGGEIGFLIDTGRNPNVFTITVRDPGKGVPQPDAAPKDRCAAETGMEEGIRISKRLMDDFRIDTRQDGTTICMGKNLPLTAMEVTPTVLSWIASVLVKTAPPNPLDEIRLQNQELIRALEELPPMKEELARVNRELDETNRGVVALFVELDDKVVSLARANEALARSELRLKEAHRRAHIGTWDWVRETDTVTWSEELFRIAGRDPSLPAPTYAEHPRIYTPASWDLLSAAVERAITTGEPYNLELELVRPDGELRWMNALGDPKHDGKGTVIGLKGTLQDITERKRNEEEIIRSATLLNDVSEMAHVGGWELDVTTKEIRWTKETYRIHEIAEDEKMDLSRTVLFYDLPGRSTMEAAMQRCIEKQEPFDLDLPFTSARGKHLWIRAMGRAVNFDSKVMKLTGTFQDITESKAADETIRTFAENLERQVTDRTSDLSDVNTKLMTEIVIRLDAEKQLTKNVGEKEVLLREVHHRVKNNLQIIISLLNLQSRYITDETTLSVFRESQNRIKAMALVHEKLYRSANLSKIDLDDYLRFLGNSLLQFYGIKGKGITFTTDIRDISLAIDTVIPLGLMINELISNSLKYAFPNERKGEISLAIHRQDHTLTIKYKENGVGIPADLDWRNATSLGLRLVISLVDQLDGTIELDRSAGTAFTIVAKEKE